MLKETFLQLLLPYTTAPAAERQWQLIETYYTEPHRHYHTLAHLQYLLQQLLPVKRNVENWEALLLALYYHDLVYNTARNDNEEQSAELAAHYLQGTQIPKESILLCRQHILATKSHVAHQSHDTNLFTDADLSVLGSTPEAYLTYAKQIRQEYSHTPYAQYVKGRTTVLQHFLQLPFIYKTAPFQHLQVRAKENMVNEITLLQQAAI